MSGTSRIGGYGGYSGQGRNKERSASLARFCRGRKQGDTVSGVFLRLENESHGWALLEGEELLAHLPEQGPRPLPGTPVFFRIEALHPEVVLRMLPGNSPDARLAAIIPPLPLSQEAAHYAASRDRFDALLAARPVPLADLKSIQARKNAFVAHVSADPALFAAFADVQVRSRALGRAGASSGLIFFRHMPWISSHVSGVEVSLWEKGQAPIIAGATLPAGDRILLHGEMRADTLRYRLALIPAGGYGAAAVSHTALSQPGVAENMGMLPVSGFGARAQTVDLVGLILALAADSGALAVGRFSRRL